MCFEDFYKIKTKFAHEKHMVRLSNANVQVCANVHMQMCKYTCIPYGPYSGIIGLKQLKIFIFEIWAGFWRFGPVCGISHQPQNHTFKNN